MGRVESLHACWSKMLWLRGDHFDLRTYLSATLAQQKKLNSPSTSKCA